MMSRPVLLYIILNILLGAASLSGQTTASPTPSGAAPASAASPVPAGDPSAGAATLPGSQTAPNTSGTPDSGPQPLPPTSSQPTVPNPATQNPAAANPTVPNPVAPNPTVPNTRPAGSTVPGGNVSAPGSKPAAPAPSTLPQTGTPPAQSPLPPGAVAEVPRTVLPAGTKILLALRSGVNTKTARVGDGVYLVSTFPVTDGTRVVIPAGMYVQGTIDRVVRPGRVKGRAEVAMHFTNMIFPNGVVVTVPGTVDGLPGSAGPRVKDPEGTIQQAGTKGRDAGQIAQTAATGAEIGTIAGAASGHVGQGLGIGSGAGLVGGLIGVLFTRGDDVVIEPGSTIEMVLQRPLELQQNQLAGLDTVHNDQSWTPGPQPTQLAKPKAKRSVLCPLGVGCGSTGP